MIITPRYFWFRGNENVNIFKRLNKIRTTVPYKVVWTVKNVSINTNEVFTACQECETTFTPDNIDFEVHSLDPDTGLANGEFDLVVQEASGYTLPETEVISDWKDANYAEGFTTYNLKITSNNIHTLGVALGYAYTYMALASDPSVDPKRIFSVEFVYQ